MGTFRKVRAGSTYYFDPVMMDISDPKTSLVKGDKVTVVKLRGCPPPNTMGHCHVSKDGQFVGLVHCNSLTKENPLVDLDAEEDEDWNKLVRSGVMKKV